MLMDRTATAPSPTVLPGIEHSASAEFIFAIFAVFGSAAGTGLALFYAARDGLPIFYFALLVSFLLLTAIGVTGGLHRLFTHRSYKSKRGLALFLALAGTAAGQGFFLRWVYEHRLHHRRTDVPGDPHTPYFDGDRALGAAAGLLHSHLGWLFKPRPPIERDAILDLVSDPLWLLIDRWTVAITALGLLLPGLAGLAYASTWHGFVLGVLWGGLVRMFTMYHITWSVNSICHFFGGRTSGQTHRATNHALIGWLALGEGWHSNHHEAPASARHGGPGQIDLTYLFLLAMRRLGLVWDLRLPKPHASAAAPVHTLN